MKRFHQLFQLSNSSPLGISLLMGFFCGLPFALSRGSLKLWLTDMGVDLKSVALSSLIALPYSFKVLWAPFLDHYVLPFLGRRRGWLFIAQLLLVACIAAIALIGPEHSLSLFCVIATGVAFFSATQDLIVDAYRRESLQDSQIGLGATLYVYGYRVAMMVSRAGVLIIAQHWSWNAAYGAMAVLMAVAAMVTLFIPEPPSVDRAGATFATSVVGPFKDFFTRYGLGPGLLALIFILIYKMGDSVAAEMIDVYFKLLGYSLTDIALVVKTIGVGFNLLGLFLGGILLLKLPLSTALILFGIGQLLSTMALALLSYLPVHYLSLGAVVGFENLSIGMATAAFVTYLTLLCNKKFTATQYALFSSLMTLPTMIGAARSGAIIERIGWEAFFVGCSLIALPGILIVKYLPKGDQGSPGSPS